MDFSERPPSTQWSALMFRGEQFAEVWFKPDGEPLALTFRIPRDSFQIPGVGQRLTVENLLKAVGIAPGAVGSWAAGGEQHSGADEPDSELGRPLAPPPQDADHLTLHVNLKPPRPADPDDGGPVGNEAEGDGAEGNAAGVAPEGGVAEGGESESDGAEGNAAEIDEAKWQFLEERWKLILGLEAGLEGLRVSMEGLRSELDAAARKSLPLDVKVHAVSVDVVQWDKAKSRIRFAVPKVREFIHRSIWAAAAAERKRFGELFENHIEPRVPFPEVDEAMVQLDGLLKDRQTLYAQGMTVHQDCKRLLDECQGALRTLQNNAAARARKKKS